MNFLIKSVLTKEQVNQVRSLIVSKKDNFTKNIHIGENFKQYNIYSMSHENICKINILIDSIISEKVIHYLRSEFKKIFLINFFTLTANGYSHRLHRDGQSLGFNKKALEFGEKIFKIIFYFNNYESNIIKIGIFPSKPVKFFKEEKKFVKLNYYLENYLKKYFLKNSGYQKGDTLVFDNNTWHSAKPTDKVLNLDQSQFNKIISSYEVVVNDLNIAKSYAEFSAQKYNIKTSYKTNFHQSLNYKLSLFDDIIDLT